MCTDMHAYEICHKQTSICASTTAGMTWQVSVKRPSPGESSVFDLHSVLHLGALSNILQPFFFSIFLLILLSHRRDFLNPPPRHTHPHLASQAMFLWSHLSGWVTACKDQKCGTTMTWGASLYQACLRKCPCVALYTPFHTLTPPRALKALLNNTQKDLVRALSSVLHNICHLPLVLIHSRGHWWKRLGNMSKDCG